METLSDNIAAAFKRKVHEDAKNQKGPFFIESLNLYARNGYDRLGRVDTISFVKGSK